VRKARKADLRFGIVLSVVVRRWGGLDNGDSTDLFKE